MWYLGKYKTPDIWKDEKLFIIIIYLCYVLLYYCYTAIIIIIII